MSDAAMVSEAATNPRPAGAGAGRRPTGHGEGGPASKRMTVAYGVWLFLLSDIVLFSGFFAAYAVLAHATAGGPGGHELFDLRRVAMQTALLLLSSYSCGLSTIATERSRPGATQLWLLVTGLLGAGFLGLEIYEFAELMRQGASPDRSGFLSAFFALVGLHGAHVGLGLLWLGTMMAQVAVKGLRPDTRRRLLCFSLFWHALDIVWVALFILVYILGSLA